MVDTRGPKGLLDLAVGIRRDGTVANVVVVENKDDPRLSAETFLNQLRGMNSKSAMIAGKDIRYSGDTAAAQALVNAVRRALHLLAAASA
jgi:hypothetical protein